MTTITLPAHLASTHLLAGIEFTDGTAEVDRLGSHARRFLALTGATFGDSAPTDDALTVETMQIGDRLLTECTVPELRALAETEGIELPAKATKPEILHAFFEAFMAGD